MADQPKYTDAGEDGGAGTELGSPPGRPRWVKVSAIIALALVVLAVVVLLVGGGPGGHGPGRHTGGEHGPASDPRDARRGEDGRHEPPPGVDHGADQP